MSFPVTQDVNGYQQEGFGPFVRNINRGERASTAHAFINERLPPLRHLPDGRRPDVGRRSAVPGPRNGGSAHGRQLHHAVDRERESQRAHDDEWRKGIRHDTRPDPASALKRRVLWCRMMEEPDHLSILRRSGNDRGSGASVAAVQQARLGVSCSSAQLTRAYGPLVHTMPDAGAKAPQSSCSGIIGDGGSDGASVSALSFPGVAARRERRPLRCSSRASCRTSPSPCTRRG